jgi:hypothetical protein
LCGSHCIAVTVEFVANLEYPPRADISEPGVVTAFRRAPHPALAGEVSEGVWRVVLVLVLD